MFIIHVQEPQVLLDDWEVGNERRHCFALELSVLGHVEGGIHKAQKILDGRRKEEEGETKMVRTRMEVEGGGGENGGRERRRRRRQTDNEDGGMLRELG